LRDIGRRIMVKSNLDKVIERLNLKNKTNNETKTKRKKEK
jgi:hypothetical protein